MRTRTSPSLNASRTCKMVAAPALAFLGCNPNLDLVGCAGSTSSSANASVGLAKWSVHMPKLL